MSPTLCRSLSSLLVALSLACDKEAASPSSQNPAPDARPADDGDEDGDDSDGDERSDAGPRPDPSKGRAVLSFGVTRGVRRDSGLDGALAGSIHGALYRSRDIGLTGPVRDAVPVANVRLDGVDLRSEGATGGPWTSELLAPGQYTFLGFLDIDGNAGADAEPDRGDPVTLPATNEIEIKAGQDSSLTAVFDLVFFSF